MKLAVDVTGEPDGDGGETPPGSELLFGSIQIMQSVMISAQLERHPVDVLVAPDVAAFKVLDFFKVEEILAANAHLKEQVKRELDAAFNRVST